MNPDNTPYTDRKSLRLLRPSIVVLCGPAACGKSTFAQRHFRPTQIISSDWARALVCDDERDQRFNAQAFALVHFLIEQRLTLNRLCVVDSTALTAQARRDLLDIARKLQVPSTLVLFNVPLETCIERDGKRERSVGKAIVERQYESFDASKEAIRGEGFDQVVEFQEGDLEKVQIEILFRPVARAAPRPQRPEAGGPRRFERPAQPAVRRPPGPDGSTHSAAKLPLPPTGPSVASPRPAASPVSTAKEVPPKPAEVPSPITGAKPQSSAPPSAPPAPAQKPSLPTTAIAPAKPAPSPVVIGTDSSDRK